MKCEQCGAEGLPADSTFCMTCGARQPAFARDLVGSIPVFNGARSTAAVALEVPPAAPVVAGEPRVESPVTPGSAPDAAESRGFALGRDGGELTGREVQPAGFWRRLGARLVDGVIVTLLGLIPAIIVYYIVYQAVLPDGFTTQDEVDLADGSGTLAAFTVYVLVGAAYAITGWAGGGTVGMRAVGLRLRPVHGDGEPGFGRAFARWLVSVISGLTFGLGYFAMLWDKRRQTWHDAAAGTIVIEAR